MSAGSVQVSLPHKPGQYRGIRVVGVAGRWEKGTERAPSLQRRGEVEVKGSSFHNAGWMQGGKDWEDGRICF